MNHCEQNCPVLSRKKPILGFIKHGEYAQKATTLKKWTTEADERQKLATFNATPSGELSAKDMRLQKKYAGDVHEWDLQMRLSNEKPMLGMASWVLSAITLVSWAGASILASVASKNASEKQKEDGADKAYDAIAKMVAQVPEDQRTEVLAHVGSYMSTREDLPLKSHKSTDIAEEVAKRVQTLENSPWIEAVRRLPVPGQGSGAAIA